MTFQRQDQSLQYYQYASSFFFQGKAFITLCTSDAYAVGVAVLSESLRSLRSHFPLYCMIYHPRQLQDAVISSSNEKEKQQSSSSSSYFYSSFETSKISQGELSLAAKNLLLLHTDGLILLPNLIQSTDLASLFSIGRQDLFQTLTKIYVWNLNGSDPSIQFVPSPSSPFYSEILQSGALQSSFKKTTVQFDPHSSSTSPLTLFEGPLHFERLVFLDADMIFIQPIDELLIESAYADTFAAAPDIGWPDNFNSGLMVITPNASVYQELYSLAQKNDYSYDGADQGLLNIFYSQWSVNGRGTKRLPFLFNVAFSSSYTYSSAFRYFNGQIRGIHFIGAGNKPWQARQILSSGPHQNANGKCSDGIWILSSGAYPSHMVPYLNFWWQLFFTRAVSDNVSSFGGLSAFGIFGGPQNANDLCSLSKEARERAFGTFSDSYNALRSFGVSDASNLSNLRPSYGEFCDTKSTDGVNLSDYRIAWHPQVEKLFMAHPGRMMESTEAGRFAKEGGVRMMPYGAVPFDPLAVSAGASGVNSAGVKMIPDMDDRLPINLKQRR